MKTLKDLYDHIDLCVGYDQQGEWMSTKPLDTTKFGFVYFIHNTLYDTFYVGAKQYKFYVNGEYVPSNWKEYYGSSKYLEEDINKLGEQHFDRYAISEWLDKNSLFNAECNLQHKLDVLSLKRDDEYVFYNRFVNKSFRPQETVSETTKRKISESKRGYKHTEEAKKKISENHADVSGESNPMYGKFGEEHPAYGYKHTIEAREKISKRVSGANNPIHKFKDDPQYRETMSKATSGDKNGMYGKKHSEETKQKIRDALKKK